MRSWREDHKVYRFMTRLTELVQLNLLTMLCCLPVITAGASLTAMHDVIQQIARGEEGYIGRRFFKVLKENMKAGILLGLPFILIFGGVIANLLIFWLSGTKPPLVISLLMGTAGFAAFFVSQWVFVLQARYSLSWGELYKTAFLLSTARVFRTIGMGACWILTVIVSQYLFTLPFLFLFGLSVPGRLQAAMYMPILKELEGIEEESKEKSQHGVMEKNNTKEKGNEIRCI